MPISALFVALAWIVRRKIVRDGICGTVTLLLPEHYSIHVIGYFLFQERAFIFSPQRKQATSVFLQGPYRHSHDTKLC